MKFFPIMSIAFFGRCIQLRLETLPTKSIQILCVHLQPISNTLTARIMHIERPAGNQQSQSPIFQKRLLPYFIIFFFHPWLYIQVKCENTIYVYIVVALRVLTSSQMANISGQLLLYRQWYSLKRSSSSQHQGSSICIVYERRHM